MGFYHPATLVKDAQRHGVRFAPIDVQESDWECRVEPDGRVRLGLMYVNGLRRGRSAQADRVPTSEARRAAARRGCGARCEAQPGGRGPASAEKRLRTERCAKSPERRAMRDRGTASAVTLLATCGA